MERGMQSINPATDMVINTYQPLDGEQLKWRLLAAANSQYRWSILPIQQRVTHLEKLSKLLIENIDVYSKLITDEMGKPILQSRAEIKKCAGLCNYYVTAERMFHDEIIKTEATESFITFQPLGVVLGIMPWNYPFWQVFRFAIATLIAGNGVVIKHAPNVFGCALAIETLFKEAGFPENLLTMILVNTSTVADVIGSEHIAAVTLTGSDRAGIEVAQQAGKHLKKAILELGGSDPFIILDDAKFPDCVEAAATARLSNTGQSCIAAKRFIIAKSRAEEFISKLLERVQKKIVGDPMNEATEVGPIARRDLLEKLETQVDTSVKLGAKVLCGGRRLESPGYYYPPTILVGARKGMPVYDEEIFGPVFTLLIADSDDHAVHIANDSPYGLGASIWTQEIGKAKEITKRLQTGSVFINAPTVSHFELPFGGIKRSGYGRELSHYGLKEFVNVKTVFVK